MIFLLLFQNLLHELENRSLFHQRRVLTSGLLIWALKNFHSIYCLAAVAEFPAGVTSQEESFLTNRQMRDPSTHRLFQSRGLLSAMQDSSAGCPWVHKPVLTVPAQGSPVPVLQLPAWGSLHPHLSCALTWLHPFWQPGARHCHCQNCSLISGRLI